MYTLSHDPSSDTQPSSEVTIETKRHRSAEVDTVFTSARCDADLADAPSRVTYTASKSCSSASQPSESNCVTGTPGNCVAGYSSIDISSSLLSCASTCVSGTNMSRRHHKPIAGARRVTCQVFQGLEDSIIFRERGLVTRRDDESICDDRE